MAKHSYFYGTCADCKKPVNNYLRKPIIRCQKCWHAHMRNHPDEHPFYKNGKTVTKCGYVLVIDRNHPRRNKHNDRIFEHILVAEKMIGRRLKPSERVHHINHVRSDNRPENLEVMKSHKDHMAKHRLATHCKRCGKSGQMRRGYCYHHYETWRAVGFVGTEPPPSPRLMRNIHIGGKHI